MSKILSKAGVRKGPGKKLAESATSLRNRGTEDGGKTGSNDFKPIVSGKRHHENGLHSDHQSSETLKVVVEGVPPGSSVGKHHRSPRLQPLPAYYTSKHSIPS